MDFRKTKEVPRANSRVDATINNYFAIISISDSKLYRWIVKNQRHAVLLDQLFRPEPKGRAMAIVSNEHIT